MEDEKSMFEEFSAVQPVELSKICLQELMGVRKFDNDVDLSQDSCSVFLHVTRISA